MTESSLRVCRACRQAKPVSEYFTYRLRRTRGFAPESRCKACKRESTRAWRAARTPPRPAVRATDAQVLAAVRAAWAEAGRPPALGELAARLGYRSPASLLPPLARLAAAGRVERGAGRRGARCVWPAGLRAKIMAMAAELQSEKVG